MADRTTWFKDESHKDESHREDVDQMSDAMTRVREDVERLVQGFDVQVIAKRVEEFGKENPIGLALTALTLGVATGILMRGKGGPRPSSSENF